MSSDSESLAKDSRIDSIFVSNLLRNVRDIILTKRYVINSTRGCITKRKKHAASVKYKTTLTVLDFFVDKTDAPTKLERYFPLYQATAEFERRHFFQ